MMTGPNGLRYNIEFNDETNRVVLILPYGNRESRLEFENVRDVLEFIGKPIETRRYA